MILLLFLEVKDLANETLPLKEGEREREKVLRFIPFPISCIIPFSASNSLRLSYNHFCFELYGMWFGEDHP